MIITCPECETRYNVDAANFPDEGKKVRCAKCAHVWFESAPDRDPDAAVPFSPLVPDAVRQGYAPPEKPSESPKGVPEEDPAGDKGEGDERDADEKDQDVSGEKAPAATPAPPPADEDEGAERSPLPVAALAGWGALLAVLLLCASVLSAYRTEIVRLWPAAGPFYAALGEPVNVRGIEFRNVSYESETENGLPVLSISGEIANISGETEAVPKVRVALRNEREQEIYHWTFDVPEAELDPEETAAFVTRLSSPPVEAREFIVRFILPSEEAEGL